MGKGDLKAGFHTFRAHLRQTLPPADDELPSIPAALLHESPEHLALQAGPTGSNQPVPAAANAQNGAVCASRT